MCMICRCAIAGIISKRPPLSYSVVFCSIIEMVKTSVIKTADNFVPLWIIGGEKRRFFDVATGLNSIIEV